jgi:hypothetical protein
MSRQLLRRLGLLAAAGICLLAGTVSADAAVIYYLEVPGVTGPLDAPDFSGAFEAESYAFGTTEVSTGGGGLITVSDFIVKIPLNADDAAIESHFPKVFPDIYLDIFKDTSDPTDFLRVTLGDAFLSALDISLSGESLTFDYERLEYTYHTGGGGGGGNGGSGGTCNTGGVTCPPLTGLPEPSIPMLLSLAAGLMLASELTRRARRKAT